MNQTCPTCHSAERTSTKTRSLSSLSRTLLCLARPRSSANSHHSSISTMSSFLGFFDLDDAVSPVESYGLITFRSRSSLGDGSMLRRLSNTSDSDTSDSYDTTRRLGRPDEEALKAEVRNKARQSLLKILLVLWDRRLTSLCTDCRSPRLGARSQCYRQL